MVDHELLRQSIDRYNRPPYYSNYVQIHPCIEKLFNKYYCVEMTKDFYDSEPEIPHEWDFENPECMKIWEQLCKDYEPRRLSFNNWQEVYVEGNWGLAQKKVDSIAREILEDYQNLDNRIFVANYDDDLYFYIYARDLPEMRDYQIILRPRSI